MKHQISLFGGQLLPIYIGIKEFSPNKVYCIVSEESKEGTIIFKELFREVKFNELVCEPFDFYSIKKNLKNIIDKIDINDEIWINLTGGTKIMLLAAQSVITDKQVKGFYINQDYSLIEVPSYSKKSINSQLTIKDFFSLSGHKTFTAKTLRNFTASDFNVSNEIELFAMSSKMYSKVTEAIRKKFRASMPDKGAEIMGNTSVKWDKGVVEILNNNKLVISFKSNNVKELFFNAGWWELAVASEVTKWAKAKEVMVHCELPFKSDNKALKNEIDILLNTGNKLIFIECKSGNIKQEDINKMKVIKQTYGGIISKSLLVSRFMPSQSIMEKCKELDIEIYYVYAFRRMVNPLKNIIRILDKIEKRTSI